MDLDMILGIDPGLHGALVVLDPHTKTVLRAHNVPTFTLERNGKKKGATDIHGVVSLMAELASIATHVFQELVGPMSKQGVSSVWSFARGDTALETAAVASKLPFTRVPPGVWKKALGVPADKDGALLRANQLMPASAHHWQTRRLELNKENAIGIAEAAMIAYYGAQKILA